MDCKSIYTGSIPVAISKFAEVVQLADTAPLKRASFESSNLSFGTNFWEYGVIGNISVSKTDVPGSNPGTPAKVIAGGQATDEDS